MSVEQMHFENCLSVAKSKEERLLQLLVTAGYKRHSSLTSECTKPKGVGD